MVRQLQETLEAMEAEARARETEREKRSRASEERLRQREKEKLVLRGDGGDTDETERAFLVEELRLRAEEEVEQARAMWEGGLEKVQELERETSRLQEVAIVKEDTERSLLHELEQQQLLAAEEAENTLRYAMYK